MTLEEKYRRTVLALQAIAQRDGRSKLYGYNEWTEAEAFRDCKRTAEKCLKIIGEPTSIPRGLRTKADIIEEGTKLIEFCRDCDYFCGDKSYKMAWCEYKGEMTMENNFCEHWEGEN